MIDFMKNYSLENIRNKLLILYVLNVADIIFTILLLNTGFYIEANIFMSKALENPFIGLMLKVILPALLFVFIYFRIQKATAHQLRKSNFFINGAIAFYTFLNMTHIIWVSILPYLL